MDIRTKYLSELGHKFKYFPNWLPNRPIEIGDVGVMHKSHFESEFNLLKRIPEIFKYRTSEHPSNISYYSEGTSKVKLHGSAQLPITGDLLKADQEMKILFNNANSIFLEAKGALISRLEVFDKLKSELIELYRKDKWDLDYVFITEVVKADFITIIVTNKKNAEVVLKTDSNVQLIDSDLASLQATFSISNQRGTEVCIVGEAKTIPLFKIRKLKKNFFNKKIAWDKNLFSKTEAEFSLDEVNFEDYF